MSTMVFPLPVTPITLNQPVSTLASPKCCEMQAAHAMSTGGPSAYFMNGSLVGEELLGLSSGVEKASTFVYNLRV